MFSQGGGIPLEGGREGDLHVGGLPGGGVCMEGCALKGSVHGGGLHGRGRPPPRYGQPVLVPTSGDFCQGSLLRVDSPTCKLDHITPQPSAWQPIARPTYYSGRCGT